MEKHFYKNRNMLNEQFKSHDWIVGSGLFHEELESKCRELEEGLEACGVSHAMIKAKTFEYITKNGQIALDENDIFADKLNGRGIIARQKQRWLEKVYSTQLREEKEYNYNVALKLGAYMSTYDFGHTSPNSKALISLGFKGLLDRIESAKASHEALTDEQAVFYESCDTVLNAMIGLVRRHAEAIKDIDPERYACLLNISEGAPKSIYEALQLLWIYFYMHEYIADTRVRTLGRLDILLYSFYKNDIKSGRYTEDEIREIFRYFLNKIWSAKVPYDLPFMIGGKNERGDEVTNELSYMIIDIYNELNIHSPKIHIRISEKTPDSFVKKVLSCIRGGNSSILLVNDRVGMEALMRVGIEKRDAKDFILIGCYEPCANGKEIGCTGSASVNLAKVLELVFTSGRDYKSGAMLGIKTHTPQSYEEFVGLLKAQIKHLTDEAVGFLCGIEKYYYEINPDPILSSLYDRCVESGVDAYNYGAKYNNSAVNFAGIATLTDSVLAVRELVYEKKIIGFSELGDILKSNWENAPELRTLVRKSTAKYGNGIKEADELAADFAKYCASLVNGRKNARGGIFKAGIYSIDRCFSFGASTMATPDGRMHGEPLSKNLCASPAMDKKGITALINSVTKIDHTDFPNGSVLDVVLHPTAVSGDDGLDAFYGLVKAYFRMGGFAMHGNVFNSETLHAAQSEPEKYSNLQVRLCGWNIYFNDLTRQQQDEFIKQTDGMR